MDLKILGPIVQNIVSLTQSLVVKMLRVLLQLESRKKGMKHSWKNIPSFLGIEPGPPGLKSNALTTEPKSRLPDAVVRDWIYT